ncbi:hypothetical protein Tco_0953022 [Tanacetum coccineum]|uniref:Reverse transcriptase domain-containing protein n=1 Tax=Tanacetum coccineum TaxID=301880 RepID=A0ABQ5DYN8_9ASTR
MSTNEQTLLSQPTSVVRNTLGKEQVPQDLSRPISNEALREYCDKNYHQILLIIAEKVHQEKVQQEKIKAVKARLNFEEASQHFESGTPIRRRDPKERLGPRRFRSRFGSPEPRRGRSELPRKKGPERKTTFKRLEKGVFYRLGDKGKSIYVHSNGQGVSHTTTAAETLKAVTKVLIQEQRNPLPRNMAAKGHPREERRICQRVKEAREVIESQNQRDKSRALRTTYLSLRSSKQLPKRNAGQCQRGVTCLILHLLGMQECGLITFPKNQLIHNIRQRDGESTEEFVRRYKLECRDVKGAPECMKISGFMHRITYPEIIKRLHDKIPKSVDEMMRVTTAFLRGEVADSNRERKKSFPSWKQLEAGQKKNFKKGGFRSQQRPERKQDIFTLLIKTPKEILALDKGKFKPPPPMTTPRKIEEMLKAGKLSHLIKELKQSNGKDQAKTKKGGSHRKRQTACDINGEEDGTEDPMVIEAEIGGHCVHRMCVDGGSSSEILYEHCFNRFRPKVKNQMIPAATPLVGFSGEIIWPLGQILLLVRIGDEEHSTSAWMNFMVVRSPSPYNGIIGRPGVRKIWAIPSTAHRILKFPGSGGIVILRSSRIIPLDCTMVAIHPEYPEQTVAICSTLTKEGRKELRGLLRRNLDIFAWKSADMTGVPRHIADHRLNIREGCLPVRQMKRGQAPERNKAICEEVEKLVDADIMKEVHYDSWLLNPVMVKKHDDSWRMCVDFKDLNKARPKDGYPLSEIDWKVESLCGYPFKCFLDAYK